MIEIFLMLQLISVCSGGNPCVDYDSMYMADGLRSSAFDSRNSEVSLCDASLDPATWYRFEHDAGNKLIERPVEPWYCGTQAPIWLNGTHPKDNSEVTASVCATYSPDSICGWNGTVRIRLCNESGSEYYVYKLDVPPGCPLAYCVDADSHKSCSPPLVWLEDDFRCGVSENTTGPILTAMTTLATTSSLSSERESSTTMLSPSTKPASPSWSNWGPWSAYCSKPCDYGHQSRKRTCGQLPCKGPGHIHRLCNKYNCQRLSGEKTRGIGFVLLTPASRENTIMTIVLNQQAIQEMIRKNINDICSQNVSMCCGWQYNGISSLHQEFVQSGEIYPAQGNLKPRTDNTVYYQVIAIVNEDVDRAICKSKSQRTYASQVEPSHNYLSFDVMKMASGKSEDNIFKDTGLVVIEYIDPATTPEDNNVTSNVYISCPWLTCVLPIVICVTVVVAVIVTVCCCCAKRSLKPKKEQVVPAPEPTFYYEILPQDLRRSVKLKTEPSLDIEQPDNYEVISPDLGYLSAYQVVNLDGRGLES